MAATATDRLRVLSPDEVGRLIADGQTITIIDGFVVRVDAWLSYHPGGKTVIQHMIGRDATDEFNV